MREKRSFPERQMKQKHIFYTELCYVLGILILAFGTALMERADLGVSMVVAPAYILHLAISPVLPFFTFGMAEYTMQAVLLILMIVIVHRFRISYLFSFITALIYGFVLDGMIALVALLPELNLVFRIILFLLGLVLDAFAIALLFHTYISPEVYELFVMEFSDKFHVNIHKCKTYYDCISCLFSILLSFLFFGFGHFEGIKIGTVFCALVNGLLISLCSKFWESHFIFKDRFPTFKKFFGAQSSRRE